MASQQCGGVLGAPIDDLCSIEDLLSPRSPVRRLAAVALVLAVVAIVAAAANAGAINKSARPAADRELVSDASSPIANYIGHIVHWNGDQKTQKTAWLVVVEEGVVRRRWVPDTATFWCLKREGASGLDELSTAQLDAMPDDLGIWAHCGDSVAGSAGCQSSAPRSSVRRGDNKSSFQSRRTIQAEG